MKLYKISQKVNNDYDTYNEAVVCAENEHEARKIHPNGELNYAEEETNGSNEKADRNYGTWAKKRYVVVEYIGEADNDIKKGVIVASFNAG